MATLVSTCYDRLGRITKSSYSDAQKADAMRFAFTKFMRETLCTVKEANVTLTVDTAAITVANWASGPNCHPANFIRGEFTTDVEEVVPRSYHSVQQRLRWNSSSGTPEMIGFRSYNVDLAGATPDGSFDVQAVVWPKPDSSHLTMLCLFVPNLTDVTTSTLYLNVPDHYIDDVLATGAVAVLAFNDPHERFQSEAWSRFVNEVIPKAASDAIPDIATERLDAPRVFPLTENWTFNAWPPD